MKRNDEIVQRPALDGTGKRFAIIAARFNEDIVTALVHGARNALIDHQVGHSDISLYWVPGAVELPVVAQALASRGDQTVHGIIALGCVIRGDTDHYDHVARSCTDGLTRVALDAHLPVSHGVLTVASLEQARERAGGSVGNKGIEAALAALETVILLGQIHQVDP